MNCACPLGPLGVQGPWWQLLGVGWLFGERKCRAMGRWPCPSSPYRPITPPINAGSAPWVGSSNRGAGVGISHCTPLPQGLAAWRAHELEAYETQPAGAVGVARDMGNKAGCYLGVCETWTEG